MTSAPIDDLSPLAADLRRHDPDRYLATLFAPAETRDALFALYAFDHEIAKVRHLVREPMAGLIRLQWWRDALDGIDKGDVLAHPVVQGLHRAKYHGLDPADLLPAIDGRERELEPIAPPDLAALERHLAMTSGVVARAAAGILGGTEPDVLVIADQVGRARGTWELLRWLGRGAGDRPLWLPKALLDQRGLDAEAAGGEGDRAKIEAARDSLARWASDQLAAARRDQPVLPRRLLPAFFPGTLALVHLRDVAGPTERAAVAAAPIRLLWCWFRGRF